MKNFPNNELIAKSCNTKKTLLIAKNLAVQLRDYEVASQLREIEKKKFPVSPEHTKRKKLALELNLVFRMVDLNIEESTCDKIAKTLEIFKKKKGKFSIKEASKIISENKEIFDL